jgi:hypothetical protein
MAPSWLGENAGPGVAVAPAGVEVLEPLPGVAADEVAVDPPPTDGRPASGLPASFERVPETLLEPLPSLPASAAAAVIGDVVFVCGEVVAVLDDPAPVPHAARVVPSSKTNPADPTIRRDVHDVATARLLDFARSHDRV